MHYCHPHYGVGYTWLSAVFTSHICSPGLRSQARYGENVEGRIPLSILFSELHGFSLLHFKHPKILHSKQTRESLQSCKIKLPKRKDFHNILS